MKKSTESLAIGIIALTILSLFFTGIQTQEGLIIMMLALVAIIITLNRTLLGKTSRFLESWEGSDKSRLEYDVDKSIRNSLLQKEIGKKEKKIIIYHILSILEEFKTVDVTIIYSDLNIEIFTLNKIIELLQAKKVIDSTYPPMTSLPIITEKDNKKSRKLRKQIIETTIDIPIGYKLKKKKFILEMDEYLGSGKQDK